MKKIRLREKRADFSVPEHVFKFKIWFVSLFYIFIVNGLVTIQVAPRISAAKPIPIKPSRHTRYARRPDSMQISEPERLRRGVAEKLHCPLVISPYIAGSMPEKCDKHPGYGSSAKMLINL